MLAAPAIAASKPRVSSHKGFFRRHYPTVLQIALAGADAGMTADSLENGGHEDWLPTQRPAVADSLILSGPLVSFLACRWLRRHRHKRLAAILPWFFISTSAAAISYSASKGGY